MPNDTLVDTDESTYHVGETWDYKTRPGEEGSTLTIVRVGSSPSYGVIVSVRIDGLRMESPNAKDGAFVEIAHVPFAEAAIEASVTNRAAVGVPASAESDAGYEEWRTHFDAGAAGFWTVSVAEAVEVIAEGLRSQESQ